jgi:LacI family transcriptional regulator
MPPAPPKPGVSPKTVSNVLSGRLVANRRDAVARANRIRKIANEMNYRPNTAARAMSTGRFDAVALLHGTHVGQRFMPERLWTGIHEAAHQHGQHILSAMLPDRSLTDEQHMPKLLGEMAADGMLIDYIHDAPSAMTRLIDQHHLPAIWINHKRDHDCVYPDELWSGRTMAAELLKLGHTRMAYLSRRSDMHYSVGDRWAGSRPRSKRPVLNPYRSG